MGLYLVQAKVAGAYPWTTLFHHSFVNSLLEPEHFLATAGWADYLAVYYWLAHPAAMPTSLVLMVGLAVFAMSARYRLAGPTDRWFALLVLSIVYMAGHWILFPSEKDRLWVAVYVLILVSLTRIFRELSPTHACAEGTGPQGSAEGK
jgi:hypothetical protein